MGGVECGADVEAGEGAVRERRTTKETSAGRVSEREMGVRSMKEDAREWRGGGREAGGGERERKRGTRLVWGGFVRGRDDGGDD